MNQLDKINYYIKLYIENSKKDMNENESLNVHITLLKEVLSYLNEDYDIIFENRLKIELLLQEIFQNDSYVNIFINRLYSKDIKSINDFKNILYEQMQNDLQKSAILKENIKVYSNFYNSCKIFLLSSKRNAAVSKKVTEDIKQILILIKNEYHISDKDLAIYFNELNFYSQKIKAFDEKQINFINELYLKIPTIVNMGFEVISFEDINPNRKNILDSCADYIKDQIDRLDKEEIISFITEYSKDFEDEKEKSYLYQKLMEILQEELLTYYSFILDTSMSRSNEERKMLTEDYFKVLNIYTNVRDYYEKTFNKEIVIEDALLPLKEENVLIYSTSKVNPLNAKIISDLKDIPEEYYENIINLINGFKYGTLPNGSIKMLKNNENLKDVFEIKGYQTRILFKQVKDNIYCILGMFNKKSDNDVKSYKTIGKRDIPKNIELSIEIAPEIETELFNKLNQNKRTSTI